MSLTLSALIEIGIVVTLAGMFGAAIGYHVMYQVYNRYGVNKIVNASASSQVISNGDKTHVYPDATTRIKELTEARYNLHHSDIANDEGAKALRDKLDKAIEELLPWIGR